MRGGEAPSPQGWLLAQLEEAGLLPAIISPASNTWVLLCPFLRGGAGLPVLPGPAGQSGYNHSFPRGPSPCWLVADAKSCPLPRLVPSRAVAGWGVGPGLGPSPPAEQLPRHGAMNVSSAVGSWPPPPLPQGPGHLLLSSAALLLTSPPWAEPAALLGPSGLELYMSFKKNTPQTPPSLQAAAPSCPAPRPRASARWPVAGCGQARSAKASTSPRARAAPGGKRGAWGGSCAAAVPSPPGMCKAITCSPGSRICQTHPWLVSWLGLGWGWGLGSGFLPPPLSLGSLKPANPLPVSGGA